MHCETFVFLNTRSCFKLLSVNNLLSALLSKIAIIGVTVTFEFWERIDKYFICLGIHRKSKRNARPVPES